MPVTSTIAAAPEPDDVEARLFRLQNVLQQYRHRQKNLRWRWLLIAVLSCLAIYKFFSTSNIYWAIAPYFLAVQSVYSMTFAGRLSQAVEDVIELEDPRVLALLLEAWHAGARGSQRFAAVGLQQHLRRVTPDDRSMIPKSVVRQIDGLLTIFEPDLIESALAALEHVGDRESLERLRRWLGLSRGGSSGGPNSRGTPLIMAWERSLPRLAETARKTAAAIEERIEIEQRHSLLLRPADHEADTLVRPSLCESEQPPEQLLRVATANEGDLNRSDGK